MLLLLLLLLLLLYLLVVSDEDEVLTLWVQRGDGVGLQHLSSLLHYHQPRTHFLQDLTELGCPCGRHADDLIDEILIVSPFIALWSTVFLCW